MMAEHSLWRARYVVLDVETTGPDPVQHRIIEIACLVLEAGRVTERFVSLVNPHQPVPPSITALTGITTSMLLTAPEEAEVFARVAQLLAPSGTILVAHNAAFDRKFVCATLERLQYRTAEAYPWLCTYRLARRLLPPTVRRFGLDGLIEFFALPIAGRHRAGPDAEATAAVLCRLLLLAAQQGIETPEALLRLQYTATRSLPRRLLRLLQHIPARPGVYSFYTRQGQLLYVGKARNLAQRVRAHFTPTNGALSHRSSAVWDIRWEETPTELSALLREAERIWHEQPPANVLGKRLSYAFVRLTLAEPFPRLEATRALPHGHDAWIGPLPTWGHALQLQDLLRRWYRLRPCSAELRSAPHEAPCFYAELQRCSAPCTGSIEPEHYRQCAEQLLQDAIDNLQRWVEALLATIEEHVQRWEFERAAALRSLWRILHRWHQAQLPFAPQACSFLLCVPAESRALELFRWCRGSFQGSRVVRTADDPELLTWLRHAPHDTSLSWLDIARLDVLAHWLPHNRQARLYPLPPDLRAEELSELIARIQELLTET